MAKMADIWTGNIIVDDGTSIEAITLSTHDASTGPALPAAPLRFLSVVDTARIPLYLAAGPSLDVWTSSIETQEWFASILLRPDASQPDTPSTALTDEWWTCARSQSPLAILVQVEGLHEPLKGHEITEVLLYGTVAYAETNVPELRVHALPLSSDLLYTSHPDALLSRSPALTNSDDVAAETDARFLPPISALTPVSPGVEKRKRVSDVFDEANDQRKKARRKGGESVPAAAARIENRQPSLAHRKSFSIDTKTAIELKLDSPLLDGQKTSKAARPSRSPSMSSEIRPLSRKGLLDGLGKRSALFRVASISDAPEEPTVESRNRDALSRVVMAGMRMYGLQQRKKGTRSRRGSVTPAVLENEHITEEQATEDAAKDEEYKQIYHQTFKGAVLALRNHIAVTPLHSQPDRLRDVVDRLLAIFCTDPLAEPPPDQGHPQLLTSPAAQILSNPFETAKISVSPAPGVGTRGAQIISPNVKRAKT